VDTRISAADLHTCAVVWVSAFQTTDVDHSISMSHPRVSVTDMEWICHAVQIWKDCRDISISVSRILYARTAHIV